MGHLMGFMETTGAWMPTMCDGFCLDVECVIVVSVSTRVVRTRGRGRGFDARTLPWLTLQEVLVLGIDIRCMDSTDLLHCFALRQARDQRGSASEAAGHLSGGQGGTGIQCHSGGRSR